MAIDDPNAPHWNKLVPFETPISARDLNSIAGAVLRLVQFTAAPPLWITKTSAGYTVGFKKQLAGSEVFAARIEGSQPRPGSFANQWFYSFREVEWNTALPGWQEKPGGRTSFVATDGFVNPAVNGCEADNDGVGTEGVGVNFNLPALQCSDLAAIAVGAVVAMMELPITTSGGAASGGAVAAPEPVPAYWFSAPNAVDPVCPDDEGGCPSPIEMASATGLSAPAAGATRGGPGLEVVGREVRLRTDATMRLNASARVLGVEMLAPLARHPSLGRVALGFGAIGDLLVGTGAYKGQRLPVGATNYVLTVDPTAAAGVAWKVSASGGPTNTKVTSDQTFTSTTPADVTNMSFSVTNGRYYRFRFLVLYRSSATTVGLRLTLTIPAVTRFGATARMIFAAAGAGGEFQGRIASSGEQVTATAVETVDTDQLAIVEGVILPSANGTLQLQAARETDTGGATITVRQGSNGALEDLGT